MYRTMDATQITQIEIKPQPGRQEQFLSSPADIVIYGGAAGGGKTWALLLDPLRHVHVPGFGGTIFRRTYPEITNEGGLWDESEKLYPYALATGARGNLEWTFPTGCRLTFRHLQTENDLKKYLGAQITYLAFDQLETFTSKQFFYMLSRNRSLCGVRPYVRATCNPDPDSFLAEFISWWIAEDGYADLSRAGVIRWMVRDGDEVVWGNTREELERMYPPGADGVQTHVPLSVTFIPATVYDNKKLLERDPAYLARLMATNYIDRMRLLGDAQRGGNWKIRPEAGKVFNRAWFEVIDPGQVPFGGLEGRGWDFAATIRSLKNDDPDFTASIRMKKFRGVYYILDLTNDRLPAGEVRGFMNAITRQDWGMTNAVQYLARWEEEPGSASIRESLDIVRELRQAIPNLNCAGIKSTGDKLSRWKAFSTAASNGNVKVVRGAWNEAFLSALHGQPDLEHDDIPDAASVIYNALEPMTEPEGGHKTESVSPTFAALKRRR